MTSRVARAERHKNMFRDKRLAHFFFYLPYIEECIFFMLKPKTMLGKMRSKKILVYLRD
jgi:hypothetical protein